ncbi:MAG TPA: hypothetical protein VI685_08320 [Candidatus Angelobacter sp.]
MGLLDAKEYDPRPRQRLVRLIVVAVVAAIVVVVGLYMYPYWRAKRVANHFFEAIEAKDFEEAYGIYNADPNWKQHPNQYNNYTLNQFLLDWGPQSEYGPITSHSIECSTEPKKKGFKSPSGVIVVVKINHRADPHDDVSVWVEKKTGQMGLSPDKVLCE